MAASFFFALLLFILIIWIIWGLLTRKPKRIHCPFPTPWREILSRKVRFYARLPKNDKGQFEQMVMNFLSKISVTGIETDITDTDKLLVASSGIIPLFEFPDWEYRNLNEVLLYEGTFNLDYETKGRERSVLGMVGSGAMNRMMILSKPALHQGFEDRNTKSNVGIHEFIHLLDKADGDIDGIPEVIMDKQYVIPWLKLMHEEIDDIKKRDSDINPYGATNQAEFFSVASEYFFNQPLLFKKNNPELYEIMEKVFRVD